jgi:intracellular sulfur oxidation DsrE/DsrF family protein
MRKIFLTTLSLFMFSSVYAESELPIPGIPAGRDVPNAHLSPDPNAEYKVMFDLVMTDDDLSDPYPMLRPIAVYVNTLAKFGIPQDKRKIAIVLHRGSGLIGLKNEVFKEWHDGQDNPNIELIQQLAAAGVTFHLCGQGMVSRELSKDDLLPEIQVDYWALTTIIELQRQGYAKIG